MACANFVKSSAATAEMRNIVQIVPLFFIRLDSNQLEFAGIDSEIIFDDYSDCSCFNKNIICHVTVHHVENEAADHMTDLAPIKPNASK